MSKNHLLRIYRSSRPARKHLFLICYRYFRGENSVKKWSRGLKTDYFWAHCDTAWFPSVDIEPKNVSQRRILDEISSIFDLESTQENQYFHKNYWWCPSRIVVRDVLDCVSTGIVPHCPGPFSFIIHTHNNGEDFTITSKKMSKLTSR